ncbi:MAG: permease [Halanaerobiales bacterium]|nr:permease [Halanaerobiales bacterium]
MIDLITKIFCAEISYLKADWWILLFGILTAVSIKVYLGSDQLKSWVKKNDKLSVFGSIGFGTFTPLCACGTMAVILSMFASYLPWGPIMAFLVSSPLTSPSQFIFQNRFLGFKLAMGVLTFSILLGIAGGLLASFLEKRTSFFNSQYRLIRENEKRRNEKTKQEEISCCVKNNKNVGLKHQNKDQKTTWMKKIKKFAEEFYNLGIKKVLLYFMIFIAIGQLVEIMVPTKIILELFSGEKAYSIPLAAAIGLPLYVSGSSSLPLLQSILELGAGEGAILAFLIAGQGTGAAVITGMSAIIKKRALTFYVVFILLGAIFSGYIYQILLV